MSHRRHSWKGRARGARGRGEVQRDSFEAELRGIAAEERGDAGRGGGEHKTMQLCRQVERALVLALVGECGDDVLRELMVEGVRPMGSASQLLVLVRVPATVGVPLVEVMGRLEAQGPRLRHLVAGAICRKRTPMLSFACVPAAAAAGEEGGEHA